MNKPCLVPKQGFSETENYQSSGDLDLRGDINIKIYKKFTYYSIVTER